MNTIVLFGQLNKYGKVVYHQMSIFADENAASTAFIEYDGPAEKIYNTNGYRSNEVK